MEPGTAMLGQYVEARRKGLREYRKAVASGQYPYPLVLDDMVEGINQLAQVPVGLVELPIERIAGTKTNGRTNAFSSSFLPLLKEGTEFSYKWATLYSSACDEGIHESIQVYEFMNKFYVEEGNKRVSVSKYLEYSSIWANVTRIMPVRSEEKANKVYYEFCEFYKVAPLYILDFSGEGYYARFAEILGQNLTTPWSKDTLDTVKAAFAIFQKLFRAKGGNKLDVTEGDAFLIYLTFYPIDSFLNDPESLLASRIEKLWNEFLTQTGEDNITLVETPEALQKGVSLGEAIKDVLSRPRNYTSDNPLMIAFIYAKNKENSAWTYGHDLGRHSLENAYGGRVATSRYDNCQTPEEIRHAIDEAVADGSEVIFTTFPIHMQETLRAAIHYPRVKFLNCSINMTSQAVRTYYGKMHEAKYLMGALAASMSSNHRIGYIADYPIYGTVASINAFAIGASMVDPKARIHLKWSTRKGCDWQKELKEEGIYIVSGPDLIKPEVASREYGIYMIYPDGQVTNLAAPMWNWGKYYDLIVRTILDGSWDAKSLARKDQALNYWWGMETGVIDVILSEKLPYTSKKMINTLKNGIIKGHISPFDGELHSQAGVIKGEDSPRLTSDEIIKMRWLADNVVGELPNAEDLNDEAKATISVSGVIDLAEGDVRGTM